MKKSLMTLLLALPLSGFAGEHYVCQHDTKSAPKRVIEVIYPSAPAQLPCEVQYRKSGQSERLWSAQNEAGYCEKQAQAFAKKQQAFGYRCSEQS